MSEFTNKKDERVKQLLQFAQEMMTSEDKARLVQANEKLIRQIIPSEVIALFDCLVLEHPKQNYSQLKKATNKMLHLFHKPLLAYPAIEPPKNSFLYWLAQSNQAIENRLKTMKKAIKSLNKTPTDQEARKQLLEQLKELQQFDKHYQIKENVLFPSLEKHWPDFHCVQLMWSYHDDIRQQMKDLEQVLIAPELDLQQMNKLVGDLFFNLLAIRFREEHILFPQILETIPEKTIQSLLEDSREIGFPFVVPVYDSTDSDAVFSNDLHVNLGTGQVSAKQIQLIFNHLPVDITFVDEHDTVRFFSTPKKRIFPRTKAIIGRKVHHCHPPESVHVVEEIVSEFKAGKQDQASFWINFKDEKILIQYFALRNELGEYKGVIEVTQEINAIRELKGEKRLLDWSAE